jgi:hypothetical protein
VRFLTTNVTPVVNRALLGLHNLELFRLGILVSPYLEPGEVQGQGAHRDWNAEDIKESIKSDPEEFPMSFLMTVTANGNLRFWSDSLDAEFVHERAGEMVSLTQAGDAALWHGATVHEGRDYPAPSPNEVWAARRHATKNAAVKECCHVRLHWYCATARGDNKWLIENKTQLIPEYDEEGELVRKLPDAEKSSGGGKRVRRMR